MQSRRIGMTLVIIGVILLVYTGFNYVTTERVVDLGPIQIDKKVNHPIQWSPFVGIGLLIGGVLLMLSGKKNSA